MARGGLVHFPHDWRSMRYQIRALAAVGDTAGAWKEDQWLEAPERPFMRGSNTLWRAAIHAHLDRPEDAMTLVREALSLGVDWSQLPFDSSLRPLWGYEPFERILAPEP